MTELLLHHTDEAIYGTSAERKLRRQRIRLVGIRFIHLVGGGHQMDAFTDTQEAMNLYQAMDNVRKRFGDRMGMRAAAWVSRASEEWTILSMGRPRYCWRTGGRECDA